MGEAVLHRLKTYAPNFVELAQVLQLEGYQYLPHLEKDILALTEKLAGMPEEERRKEVTGYLMRFITKFLTMPLPDKVY
nr:hypothetical protein [Adhaeribacter aquaticus]